MVAVNKGNGLALLPGLGRCGPLPVPSGWHEVDAAVHAGIRDVALACDEKLLLKVALILLVDVAEDGLPAVA